MPESDASSKTTIVLICLLWGLVGCATETKPVPTPALVTPEGLAGWETADRARKGAAEASYERYQRHDSLTALGGWEHDLRGYVDHGFALYRSYRLVKREAPEELIQSLAERTNRLVDVAEEYIRHGSLAMGEGIASEVVHEYSDLPVLTPAQRRAEALLLRYRYRQDY